MFDLRKRDRTCCDPNKRAVYGRHRIVAEQDVSNGSASLQSRPPVCNASIETYFSTQSSPSLKSSCTPSQDSACSSSTAVSYSLPCSASFNFFWTCVCLNGGASCHKPALCATDRIVVGSPVAVAMARSATRTTARPCKTSQAMVFGGGGGVFCSPRNVLCCWTMYARRGRMVFRVGSMFTCRVRRSIGSSKTT